jgi:hypothetical protein
MQALFASRCNAKMRSVFRMGSIQQSPNVHALETIESYGLRHVQMILNTLPYASAAPASWDLITKWENRGLPAAGSTAGFSV